MEPGDADAQLPDASAPEAPTERVAASGAVRAATGKREAFRNLRRDITDEELRSTGVAKLILDELERTEAERDDLRKYVDRYHEADKLAAVGPLNERLKANRRVDTLFGVGVGLGGTLLGASYSFYTPGHPGAAITTAVIGLALLITSALVKLVKL